MASVHVCGIGSLNVHVAEAASGEVVIALKGTDLYIAVDGVSGEAIASARTLARQLFAAAATAELILAERVAVPA